VNKNDDRDDGDRLVAGRLLPPAITTMILLDGSSNILTVSGCQTIG
jgi:hypothetical protein